MTTRDEMLADIRFHGEWLGIEEIARLVRSRMACTPKVVGDVQKIHRLSERCSRYLYRKLYGLKTLPRDDEMWSYASVF